MVKINKMSLIFGESSQFVFFNFALYISPREYNVNA